MPRPPELRPFYAEWEKQQKLLLDSIRPLTMEQMQLRPAPDQWAIWQLCSNMAGGRLYWLCRMLGEDDHGVSQMFKVDHTTVPGVKMEWAGWEDNEDHPRTAAEIIEAFEKTWHVVDGCLDSWSLQDLRVKVTKIDAFGREVTITPGWVINRLLTHEVHHGSEVSLILRIHGLPTALNR